MIKRFPFGQIWTHKNQAEHSFRSFGIYIKKIGEFEFIYTSPKTHEHHVQEEKNWEQESLDSLALALHKEFWTDGVPHSLIDGCMDMEQKSAERVMARWNTQNV